MAWYDLEKDTVAAPEEEEAIPLDRLIVRESEEQGVPVDRPVVRDNEEETAIPISRLRAQGEFLNTPPPRSLVEEFSAGLGRGIDQTQALGYGLLGLVGQSLGVSGLEEYGVDNYMRNMEEAAQNQASVQDPFTEIGDLGDAGLYAAGIIGEQLPQLLVSAVGGGVGGAVAKTVAKRVVGNVVGKMVGAELAGMTFADKAAEVAATQAVKAKAEAEVAKRVAGTLLANAGSEAARKGGIAGAYLANYGQIAGGSFGQIAQETGRGDAAAAAGFAVPGAALDTLGEVFLADKFLKPFTRGATAATGGIMRGAAAGLASGAAIEGGTEYLQTGLEQAAVGAADPNRTIEDVVMSPGAERERRIAATAGAVLGGPLGGVGGGFEVAFSPKTTEALNKIRQGQATPKQAPVSPAVDPQTGDALPVLDADWSEPRMSEDGVEFRINPNGQVAIFNPDDKLSSVVEGLPRFQTSQGQTYVPLFGTEYFIRRGDDNEYRTRSALASKGRALFDDKQVTTAPPPAARKPAPQKPAVETTLDDGPDLTPAAQAVGVRAKFSGYEGTIAQDGARFLLRADDGTEVELPADSEVEVVPPPKEDTFTPGPDGIIAPEERPAAQQAPQPEVTPRATLAAQPEPLPDLATMGAEEISRAALARPEVGIIDRAAESPDEMDANAVSLLRDARTTLEDSINEIENRDLDAETKSKLTTPLYEKFVKADDTLGKVPADATTQLDREIERKRQEAEQAKAERAKVAAQTVNRPPSQSEQFVNSLKQGDGVTIYLSGDQAADALSFNGRFERKRNDGTVIVTSEPDADGKTQKLAFTPNEYNRIGMLRPVPPKESPVESAVKSVLGANPTKAKAERVLGTPYTQGEAQPVFLDDGLYQNPGKTNKVPAVVRYFDKPGEPGVKEVVTFGQWNGNKRSTPFVTVRQMSEGLDVPVPDSELQNLPQGVQVEPRVMKNGQTANVVTKVEYQGNVYRRGDTAYDFSVNGRTTGPGGFREIYLNSPERLARSERARRGKETSRAKAGPGAVQSMLDGLDEADQFFVSDARARAAQFIDRRTDLDDEAKKMAADEADASIIEQAANRSKKSLPPVRDLGLFKRFNRRVLDIFESNQANETETDIARDTDEAARQIADELVRAGSTPQEAKAAVDPIVARWQSYGSFSPIKTAMTKVQSAKKAAVRSGQNRRAAEADIAAGTVGQARRAMTPAERFNERTTDAAMTARERATRLDEEDLAILGAHHNAEGLSESDQLRVEDLLEYIQGNKTYDEIYPSRAGSSEEAGQRQVGRLRPGQTRDVYGTTGGMAEGRGQIRAAGTTESRGVGANRAGGERGRNRVGRTDDGQAGTVQGTPTVQSGRSGVAGTPNQRNASAARRAFLGSFIRNADLIALLPEATVERIYQAVSTTLDALAASRGRRVVAAVQPNMADLLGMSVRDLVAGYREEFTSYQANRERVNAIRQNAEEAVRSRLFEGPQAALEFIAKDQDRPAFMRLIAQTMLNQAKRFGIDLNNIAMQVGIFRRQPPTGAQSGPAVRALVEEVEGAFNVTTPDGVETFEFGEGIGMTRKQAGKAARARAYDIVTGQTRTSWAGVLGVNPLADTPAGRYSAVLNLDNWHEGNDIGLTMLHEISHIFSETKFEGRENLNAVEKAAIKGLESFRVRMLKAVARANGLEVPSGNNPADIARLSKRVDDLSNPNVAGADADRRLAYLVSPNETARGLMESPEFLQLAIEVGLGDTRKRQNTVELTGPLAEAWNNMTELEAGRKVDPTSPLGRAFKDAWSATFGALEGATEGYVKPPVGANPLAQELSALNEAADFIEEQVAARGLDGTTAERDALLQEFMASRNMVQGAETTDAVVDEDAVEDPVTMSRAVTTPDGEFHELNKVEVDGLMQIDPSSQLIASMREKSSEVTGQIYGKKFVVVVDGEKTEFGNIRAVQNFLGNIASGSVARVFRNGNQQIVADFDVVDRLPNPTESRALSSNESQPALSNQGATNDRRNQPALQTSAEGMGSQGRGDQVQRQTLRPNAEPNPFVQDGVSAYNARYGLGEVVRGHYAPVDEQRARQIAAAYDALPVLDPGAATQEAYGQLAREIQQQWDYAINDMGITFEPWTQEGQPYANSREMVRDVRDNRHLWFFTGGEPHPLLNQPDADGLTMNDKLRAIHDLFGHAAEDYQFGPRGEENAWIKHSQMFTPLAQRALTTETRGQNSWVNYGTHNYNPDGTRRSIPASERPFATQKVALLPEEYMDWQGALAQSPTESRALAMEFVSPNEAENLTFDDAKTALSGQQQAQLRTFAAKVHEAFGLGDSTVTNAIGDWADGAEPTTVTEHFNPNLTYEDVKVMAALKGAMRNQKAVIPFLKRDGGTDNVYDFFIPDQTAAQARDILENAGIQYRTLIEQNGGTRVLVFDEDGGIQEAFETLIEKNKYESSYNEGIGEILQGSTREEGKKVYARTVAEAISRIRGSERNTGRTDSLRATRLSELAAEAGLTLTESRATTAPTNENRDLYFGNESSISRGPQEGGPDPSRPTGESQRIARSVHEAGGAIRDAALRVLEEKGLVRRGISLRSEKEIRTVSRAIARYLVFSDEQLNAATTPAERTLSDAVRNFREKVPLIPKAQIEQLITSEADPLAVLDTAVDRFESGIIPEDRFGRALGELAKRYGVTIGSDLDAAVATLRDYFGENPSAGATWVIEGQGTESKAYKDDNNVIYKVAPVREDLLSAAPIGRGSLTIADNQPPFFDRDGRMPIFDRLLASNNLPIHTPTEIAGFVDDGRIVIKQPYLEKAEPDAGDLVTRAKNSGVAVLPAQKEDPKFGGDINTAPLVFRIDGEPWLALDFNPRNSRMFNGTATPFDLIFRKLTDKDIAANKDIKQAVETLPKIIESRAVSAIKDGELRGFRERARHLLPEERGKLRSDTKKTFIDIFNKLPSEKEFAAAALGGRAKRGWYRASTEAIISVFGLDAPRFAALLAALSPQTSVENNLINALNTWKNWVLAGRPTDRARIISVMGESVMGDKGEDSVLEAWINNSVRALTAEDPTEIVLSGPKVNSFMLNLRGFVNEVTNDAWMANFALVDQTIFSGSLNVAGTDPGKRPGYLAMSARVRAAADYLTRLTGETWTPAEVQETVWSWAKTLYELQDRKGEKRDALEILRAGELTDDAIAGTPDFATLLADGQYRRILEEAGYAEAVGQLAGRDLGAARIGQPDSERQASAAASEAVRRGQERAARRLAELYRQRQADRATESRARGRVWRPITKTTPTGGKISQGGMFSVDELLPKQAGDAFRDSRAAIRADVSQIQELSRKLERQMRSFYKGQTPPLDTINTALGNLENPLNPQQLDEIERLRATRRPKQAELKRGQYLRENRKRFREVTQPEALAQLPEALAETIREMSAHIESLSRRLPQEGLVNGDLAITIDEALGTYLNRSYAIFDDPKWADTVRKNAKVMDAARKYIRNSIVQSKVIDLIDDAKFEGRTLSKEEATALANDSVTEDQVEGMLESYLAIGDEAPTVEILSGRIPGQKNLSMLNRRGNIAPEIQALWGRYEDPTVNYAKTVMKLSSLVANNQFLTELRDMGLEEGWLWSRENNPDDLRHPPGYVRISSDNNPTLAPIAGMYAHPMLAEGLFKMFPVGSTEEHYWWLRSAMKLTGISMAMKTVGSVASQIRNYLGNYLNLIAGGNLGLGDIASGDFARRFQNSTDLVLANTFNKYRNATRAEWRTKIDDYIRRGIVGESITTGLLEDLLTASRRAGSPDWGDYVWDKVSKPFKNVADFATRTYSAGDDWFKVMIYEAEQDKYRKAHPDWDDEQVKQKAAEIARDIHWTYSLAPAVVQDLKKFPFVAPFVTFTTEVIRTTYNMMKLARQEIMEGRDTGNKELENIGWKRVRGMTTAAFLPAAVGSASMALAGISGDDEEDLRRFLPDWQKNSQLLLFRKDNGEVSFVDISFLDPYEYFKKPLVAFTRSLRNADSADEMLLGGTMAMVRQAIDPFTSEQIFAGAIMDVMRNQDAAGRQVYNPQDTGANIGTAVARKIFIEPFTPGTITSLDRIGKAAFGIQSESGRAYSLFNELSSVMLGQRVSEMDAQQALQFKGSRFMRELRDASALFNREFVAQGTRSAGDVVSGYERSNAARRALIESIRSDYNAAIRLGVPVQRAKAILRDAGLGRDTLKMVTTGIYRPFDASEQSLDLVRSRGNTDRISAYNQAKRNAPSREVLP